MKCTLAPDLAGIRGLLFQAFISLHKHLGRAQGSQQASLERRKKARGQGRLCRSPGSQAPLAAEQLCRENRPPFQGREGKQGTPPNSQPGTLAKIKQEVNISSKVFLFLICLSFPLHPGFLNWLTPVSDPISLSQVSDNTNHETGLPKSRETSRLPG